MALPERILDELPHLAQQRNLVPFLAQGNALWPLAGKEGCVGFTASTEIRMATPPSTPLTIVTVQDLTGKEALYAIAHLKINRGGVLWVLVNEEPGTLARTDLRNLGMIEVLHWSVERWWLYEFELASYKPAPDWLNNQYWAHPERFGQDL